MTVRSFKDLVVWQKSQAFIPHLYQRFAGCRDYAFRDQIQRAAISISNNIAEGYGRQSDKALTHFLVIARGSAAEVESILLLANKSGYISEPFQNELLSEVDEIAKLLTAFRDTVLQAIS